MNSFQTAVVLCAALALVALIGFLTLRRGRGGRWTEALAAVRRNGALALLAVLALACSLWGYLMAGYGLADSVYAAAALFFVNPVNDAANLPIQLGRYLSLATTAGVVLNVVDFALRRAGHSRINRHADSTAVYTDNAWGEALAARLAHGYLGQPRGGRLEGARTHIFMYGDELRNLNLWAEHREELAGARVYILLNRADAFLLRGRDADGDPRYFNVYDLVARDYWRRHNLYDAVCRSRTVKVAIVGYGDVGRAIVRYAVLNNVYRLGQAVEYHLWGCAGDDADFLEGLGLMNGDSIRVHPGEPALAGLAGMDRVILTQPDSLPLLQRLLYAAPEAELHCYNDGATDFGALFEHQSGKLACFGDLSGILTEQGIKRESLYRQAKLLNYDYRLRAAGASPDVLPENWEAEMEAAWRALSGFYKGSNIARADHLWIERRLAGDGFDAEIPGLEHIRWCRFHLYNHWSYAPQRDNARRHHNMLTEDIPAEQRRNDEIFNRRIAELLGEA